jgi:hypothetical protein
VSLEKVILAEGSVVMICSGLQAKNKIAINKKERNLVILFIRQI